MAKSDSRQTICQAIASLHLDCTLEQVKTKLEPIIQKAVQQQEQDQSGSSGASLVSSSGISPLMAAADKGNMVCLDYLTSLAQQNQQHQLIIGRPLDRSLPSDGQNTAVHHAAMSNCWQALELFEVRMGEPASQLGSAANRHGDTPLQIATSAGHLQFLKHWCRRMMTVTVKNNEKGAATATKNATQYHATDDREEEIRRILQLKNDSGDTCITLACRYGQTEILDFLLLEGGGENNDGCEYEGPRLLVPHDEMEFCRGLVKDMETVVESGTKREMDPTLLASCRRKLNEASQCLVRLNEAVAKQTEIAVQELLLLEEEEKGTKTTPVTKSSEKRSISKNKKKKKGKRIEAPQAPMPTATKAAATIKTTSSTRAENASCSISDNSSSRIRLNTLANGTLAVIVQGEEEATPTAASTASALPPSLAQKEVSVEDLFRQRFHQSGNAAPSTAPVQEQNSDQEIDAVMDALCLDVSMLLYTPHAMALRLSPSQLDAVRQILNRQIAAVEEAQRMQSHRRTNKISTQK